MKKCTICDREIYRLSKCSSCRFPKKERAQIYIDSSPTVLPEPKQEPEPLKINPHKGMPQTETKKLYPREYRDWNREGLDEPMINPELIPAGHVQVYDEITKRWRVRKEGRNRYLPYFPVIHFGEDGGVPDMMV